MSTGEQVQNPGGNPGRVGGLMAMKTVKAAGERARARQGLSADELHLADVVRAIEWHSDYQQSVDVDEIGFVCHVDTRSVPPFDRFALIQFTDGGLFCSSEVPVEKVDSKLLEDRSKRAVATARAALTRFETQITEAFADVAPRKNLPDVGSQKQAAIDAIENAADAAGLVARYRDAKKEAGC